MTWNRGSVLSKDYFKSYLALFIKARNYSIDEAKKEVFSTMFKGNEQNFGSLTYENFILAYKELKKKECEMYQLKKGVGILC